MSNESKIKHDYFSIIVALSVTCSILTILLPYKMLDIAGFIIPGGVTVLPLIYLLDDIVTEIYGFTHASQLIWARLACLTFFSLSIIFIIHLPSPSMWHNQAAFDQVYSHSFRLLVGFIVGLLISDLVNTYLISKWQAWFQGKHFAFRSIGAAAIGEAIFSVIVGIIVYAGLLSINEFLKITISVWCFKVIYAIIIAYPGTIIVKWLKQRA